MHAALYPELTADEVSTIIGPIGAGAFHDLTDPVAAISPVRLEPDAFGASAERFTFERVATELADFFLTRDWVPAVAAVLHDEAAFLAAVRRTLAADILPFAIRPLADALVPVEGEDPADTYATFCQRILAEGLAGLASAHPVMWQRVQMRLTQRVAALTEGLGRLLADRPEIAATFDLAPDLRVTALDLSGDTHGGGRNVSVVHLEDGSKIVYKPRPVDAEAAYAQLATWLNDRFGCGFGAARVLRRDGFGYMEFVESDRATEIDLHHTGEIAALMYTLNARDMHYTNILSTDRGPVPIDLETVLHPYRHNATGGLDSERSGYQVLEGSVFGTGVLPSIVTTDKREGYVDVGYVGGGEVGAGGPFRQFRVQNPFSAHVRVAWAPEADGSAASRRDPDPAAAAAIRSAAARMVEGFTSVYRLVLEHRVEFSHAVRRLFAGARLRYIHNPTVQYEQCLRVVTGTTASSDPELAQGLLRRIGIASRGADPRMVESECAQLWATDVPYFLVGVDALDITDSSDERRVTATLHRTPLQQLDDKLSRLGERDLAVQVRLIRLAFNAKLPDPHVMTDSTHVLAATAEAGDDVTGELAAIAGELGSGLVEDMVEDRFPHLPQTWIGPVASAVPERPWPPGVLGYDLYTGRVGPALALALLGRATDAPRLVEAARTVFDPAVEILAERQYELRSIAKAGIGAYNGFAGTLWAIARAGEVLDEPRYGAAAIDGLALLDDAGPQDDRWFDTVSGGMGVLLVRMALGDETAVPASVEACRAALASGIVQRAEYSGLAHGLAGLLHLAARTYGRSGDPVAAQLAESVHREMLTAFGTDHGLRTNRTGEENYSDSWCNGTAGVVVAQAAAVRAGLVDEDALVETVGGLRRAQLATSLTLCHGMLGLYDVLADLPGPAATAGAELRSRLAAHLTPERLQASLSSPDVRYNQSPCLMVGQAGVVMHLLDRLGARPASSPLSLGEVGSGA
ncbi:type 2 lanthipeptide synthetase LanM [Luteipulveratus sp. YIM 133132]|uniref:type 2 lanthipeptide synthetase LanM n=1 Tax=Luteipulveratus flavus TaxID=3031728 RepID=UPI0023AECA22|nr:type 2 lanthipeptide synthetase LanM [Luteipulveratus sp. YIM 133132]MDE9364929.1 type 2 lanthipeptide synthetase LanM [Luteipulveratus sp. YIM 133132]